MWSCTPPAHSASSMPHHFPNSLSSVPSSWRCLQWRCSTAMESMALPAFIPARREMAFVRHVGAEIAVSSFGSRLTPPAWVPHQHKPEPPRLSLLCESREGYQNLCQLITQFKMRETTKKEGAATFHDLEQYASGLICLTGGDEGPLAAALDAWRRRSRTRNRRAANAISLAARMSMSNCNVTGNARKNGAIRQRSASPSLFNCQLSPRMESAMRQHTTARFWICLLRFGITSNLTRPAGCWL